MISVFTFSHQPAVKVSYGQERISVIDALRGFALLGMVLTHSYDAFWHSTKAEILNADISILSPLGRLFDLGANTFLVRKFYTIFSFLFGLGFAMQFQSAKAKGKQIVGRFTWRLLILLAIGIISQLLIGSGKILQTYAILGLVLIFTYKWKDKYLLLASISLFLLNSLVLWSASLPNKILYAGSDTPFHWFMAEFFGGRLLMEASLFLFGQYIGRKNVFTDTERNRLILKKACLWGGSIALLSTATTAIGKVGGMIDLSSISHFISADYFYGQIKSIQQISLSFFYVAFVVQLFRTKLFSKALNLLVPAGKMTLTTFILQAWLILVLNKMHLMHTAGLTGAMGMGILLFAFLAVFAGMWMSHFSQGPVEWLWKTLTYLKFQPVKKIKTSVSANF